MKGLACSVSTAMILFLKWTHLTYFRFRFSLGQQLGTSRFSHTLHTAPLMCAKRESKHIQAEQRFNSPFLQWHCGQSGELHNMSLTPVVLVHTVAWVFMLSDPQHVNIVVFFCTFISFTPMPHNKRWLPFIIPCDHFGCCRWAADKLRHYFYV